MAQKIKILDRAEFEQDVTLSNNSYNLLFKYNQSDDSWYLSVRDVDKVSLISGIKITSNRNLTLPSQYLNIMDGGNLWCFKVKRTFSGVGRSNFGIGKDYELLWLTDSEEVEGGIDGIVQL